MLDLIAQEADNGLSQRIVLTDLLYLGPKLLDRRGVVSHHAPPKAPAPPTAVGVRLRAGEDGRRHYHPPTHPCQAERGTPLGQHTTGRGRGEVTKITVGHDGANRCRAARIGGTIPPESQS